jgi:hypothetical protein
LGGFHSGWSDGTLLGPAAPWVKNIIEKEVAQTVARFIRPVVASLFEAALPRADYFVT